MKILTIATALIINDDMILLLKRSKDPYRNWYAFPGGKVEFGEEIEEATIREIYEETGLKVSNLNLHKIINERVMYNNAVESHFQIYYWVAKLDQITDILPSNTREGELQWFPINNVPEDIVPSDGLILVEFINNETKCELYECVLERIPSNTSKDNLVLKKWTKY